MSVETLLAFPVKGSGAVQLMAAREEWLKWRFIPNVLNAIAVNRPKLALKSAFLTWALVSLIATVLLLGGYFIYALFWNRVRV